MNPTTAVATASDSTDRVLSTVLTSETMCRRPIQFPASATVSSNCPCSVSTKNRQITSTASVCSAASSTSHAASPIGRPCIAAPYRASPGPSIKEDTRTNRAAPSA